MDNIELPSDSDVSDVEYCPDADVNYDNDNGGDSEFNSCFEESDDNEGNARKPKKTKTNRKTKKISKRKSIRKNGISPTDLDDSEPTGREEEPDEKQPKNDDEEKKRADALWADFLNDTTHSTTTNSCETAVKKEKKSSGKIEENNSVKFIKLSDGSSSNKSERLPAHCEDERKKTTVTEIFDFAGETIKVTKEIDAAPQISKPSATVAGVNGNSNTRPKFLLAGKPPLSLKRTSTGGLNSILEQINKKSKISVLEKTKLDWTNFKQNEGLSEELQTFNKGRDGYLERQDFLQRTDVKQFEIEKTLRQTKRK